MQYDEILRDQDCFCDMKAWISGTYLNEVYILYSRKTVNKCLSMELADDLEIGLTC